MLEYVITLTYIVLAIVFITTGAIQVSAKPLRVVSYNVENLFHPENDSITDDDEWTAEGNRRWSYARYYRKEENIARVLTVIGQWEGIDAAGLQEVENALVVKRLCYTLRRGEYDFVHYESPDRRGIDVAFIYKKARIDTLETRAIRVYATEGNEELRTRDILYVCAKVDRQDTIHFFVCHLPSQRSGAAESAWKREAAKQVLQTAVDSVLESCPNAQIVVMGDMNSAPKNDIRGLTNRMCERENMSEQGTHKYQGRWTYLDQFYVSPAMDSISRVEIYNAEWIQETDEKYLGLKPKRTYIGFRYQDGFSDHLPIILECRR